MINDGKPVVWLFLYIRYLIGEQAQAQHIKSPSVVTTLTSRSLVLTLRPGLRALGWSTTSYCSSGSRTQQDNWGEESQLGEVRLMVRRGQAFLPFISSGINTRNAACYWTATRVVSQETRRNVRLQIKYHLIHDAKPKHAIKSRKGVRYNLKKQQRMT